MFLFPVKITKVSNSVRDNIVTFGDSNLEIPLAWLMQESERCTNFLRFWFQFLTFFYFGLIGSGGTPEDICLTVLIRHTTVPVMFRSKLKWVRRLFLVVKKALFDSLLRVEQKNGQQRPNKQNLILNLEALPLIDPKHPHSLDVRGRKLLALQRTIAHEQRTCFTCGQFISPWKKVLSDFEAKMEQTG